MRPTLRRNKPDFAPGELRSAQSGPHSFSGLRRFLSALLCATALSAPPAHAALCGDSSGDGFFTVSDALATLRLAVSAGYDRRGDVAPTGNVSTPAGNGVLTAGDALETLKATVQRRVPRCFGANATRVAVTTAAYDFFSSGGFAVIDLATRATTYRANAVEGDAVVRASGQTPLVINRLNSNSIHYLDAESPTLPNIKQCSVSDGFNSNPQDLLLHSPTKGYVSLYAGGDLLVISPPVLFNPDVDPGCKTLISGRIDLSAFDSDGVPEMDQMVEVGGKLYVALQLLDEALQPKQNGVLAVIDTATDTATGSIPLSFANPFSATKGLVWEEFQKRIFVGGPGVTGNVLNDGGIEAINPETGLSAGMVLTGADIQANIYDFVIVGTKRAYAIVADNQANSVVDIDLQTRMVRKVLVSSTALITDIEMTETGELWVAYRGESAEDPPGLRIFRVLDNAELTATPVSLGQAPFELTFFQ